MKPIDAPIIGLFLALCVGAMSCDRTPPTSTEKACILETVDIIGSQTLVTPWIGQTFVAPDRMRIKTNRCYEFEVVTEGRYGGRIEKRKQLTGVYTGSICTGSDHEEEQIEEGEEDYGGQIRYTSPVPR